MIRIYNGSDFKLDLSRISGLTQNADSVIVRLFTTNSTIYAEYSKEDIEDNKIEVAFENIQGIGEGVITCRYDIAFDNTIYPDNEQNIIGQFTTDFYLASGVIVPDEGDDSLLSGVTWGKIVGSLDSQTDLAQRLNAKVSTSTFNETVAELTEDIAEKADIDEVQSGFDSVNDALDLKADLSGLTALHTQVDNLPTSDVISGLNSKIDTHTANTVVHVTQADKDNWNGKQASGDYASASTVNDIQTELVNTNAKFNNYYTKAQTDNAISNGVGDISGELNNVKNDLQNNYSNSAVIARDYLTKADAEDTYQTKNNYVTSTQLAETLNNYIKRAEPQVINQTETTVEIEPNILNVWGTVASLTITFAEGNPQLYNEYMIQFESGSVATTLTLPSTVQWVDDNSDIEANKTYQISIVNNLGIMEGW